MKTGDRRIHILTEQKNLTALSVPLREYVAEIEELVRQEKHAEAIAHCQHILGSYPRYLAVLRILAKLYLKTGQHGQAKKYCQQVLECLPDDLAMHLYLSAIYEMEGQLRLATSHTERAFEIRPGSGVIQRRLKVLYQSGNSTPPSILRLTSGALARMYYNRRLFSRAIDEAQICLDLNPGRCDLWVLLAKACYQDGQLKKAAEISQDVLKDHPFCQEPNLILFRLFPSTGDDLQKEVCKKRLLSLDPNFHDSESEKLDPDQGPPAVILIEKLIWGDVTETATGSSAGKKSGKAFGEVVSVSKDAVPLEKQSDSENKKKEKGKSAETSEPAVVHGQSQSPTPAGVPDWLVEDGEQLLSAEMSGIETAPIISPVNSTVEQSVPVSVGSDEIPSPAWVSEYTEQSPAHDASGDSFMESSVTSQDVNNDQGLASKQAEPNEALRAEFEAARMALHEANYGQAAQLFSGLIADNLFLPEIIQELFTALRLPTAKMLLLKNLAEAYERSGDVHQALAYYKKALDLIWDHDRKESSR